MDQERLTALGKRIEAVFRRIRDRRMADIPILNREIGVHAIGFRPWKDGAIGVLVTPWCMNLMLLPARPEDWEALPELSEHEQAFPSGRYRFTVGHEPELGRYMSCSLFSPMFGFADDAAAVVTAEAAIEALFQPDHINTEDAEAADIAAIWRGEKNANTAATDEDQTGETALIDTTPQSAKPPAISRRELLRGRLGRSAS